MTTALTIEAEQKIRNYLNDENVAEEFGGKKVEEVVDWLKHQPDSVTEKYINKPELIRGLLTTLLSKIPKTADASVQPVRRRGGEPFGKR
jgi:hypothetical protein